MSLLHCFGQGESEPPDFMNVDCPIMQPSRR